MLRYVFRRFLTAIPTLFVIVTISFFLMRVAPGGPFNQEKGLNPVIKANLERVYHLDEPLWKTVSPLSQQSAPGRFRPELQSSRFHCRRIVPRRPAGLDPARRNGAYPCAVVIGGALGICAALNQNSGADYAVIATATAGSTIPTFVIAPLFQLFFALTLKWLPVGGWGDGALVNKIGPILTLAAADRHRRATHARLDDRVAALASYPHRARARPFRLFRRHPSCAARRAAADRLLCRPGGRGLLTGSIIVETIFQFPVSGAISSMPRSTAITRW